MYGDEPMPEPVKTPARITGLDKPHDDPPDHLKKRKNKYL
jgi:hypothetical protein